MPARRRSSVATSAARKPSATVRPRATPASVVRVVDANGDSPKSWEAAVIAAVRGSDVRQPIGVEITRMWAKWDGDKPSRFHVTVRIAYRQSLKPAR
jgi:dodecin